VKPRRRRDRCPACKHPFAFNPARDPFAMTDTEFRDAVRGVTGIGRHFFGAHQLWEELNSRRPLSAARGWDGFSSACLVLGGAGGLVVGGVAGAGNPLLLFVLGMKAGILVLLVANVFRGRGDKRVTLKLPYDVFLTEYVARWQSVHGPIARLVPAPGPGTPAAAPGMPVDVAAFPADRVVVTQHAETAAMLVANGLDVEHGCAVLSLDGYPFGLAEAARETLRRNPRLTVLALHDATPEGMQLPFTLREPAWFPESTTLVVVVGLRSASGDYMLRLGVPFRFHKGQPVTLPAHLREGLTPVEVSWCEAGYRAELASLRPGPLLRLLQRAVAAAGLAGQPAHAEALRMAMAANGFVWADHLPAAAAPRAAAHGSR
jgi:hypothetical protein